MRRFYAASPPTAITAALFDLLYLLAIVCGSVLFLLFAARPSAMTLSAPVDALLPTVALDGFYGVERNATGAYRWARPQATITLPIDGPGTYELTLGAFGAGGVERRLSVLVDGQAEAVFRLGETPQHYQLTVIRSGWSAEQRADDRQLRVTLVADGYAPGGDSRVLGPAITTISLSQRAGQSFPVPAQLALIAFVSLCFLAVRSMGLPAKPFVLLLLGIGLAGFASAAYAPTRVAVALLRGANILLRSPWLIFGCLTAIVLTAYAPALWRRPRLLHAALWVVMGTGILLEVGAILWLVWAKPRQFPFSDEFSTVRWLMLAREGRFGWHTLGEFYYGHRLILMKPIHLAFIELTDWHEQLLLMLNLVVISFIALCLYRIIRQMFPSRLLCQTLTLVVILWLLGLSQYEHFMTIFGLQYLLAIGGFTVGLWALYARPHRDGFALAAVGITLASLSSFQGLAGWVCLIPLIALRGTRSLLLWIGLAVAVIVPYSHGFPFNIAKGSVGLDHVIPFTLATLGAPLGTLNDLRAELVWMGDPVGVVPLLRAQVFTIVSVVIIVFSLLAAWRLKETRMKQLVWLCLLKFAAAATAATALYGSLEAALTSRYQNFSMLWWIGACGCALVAIEAVWRAAPVWPARRVRFFALRLALVCASVIAVSFVESGINAFITAQRWQAAFARKNACIFAYATVPDACMESPNAAFIRLKMAYLAREQLMMFAGHPEVMPPVVRPDPDASPALSALQPLGMQSYAKFAGFHDPFPGNPAVPAIYPPLIVPTQQPYTVSGWAVDPTTFAPAAGVFVTVDGGAPIWARCGKEAPWPADNFGAALRESGFALTLPATALTPGQHELRIVVVNAAMTGYFSEQRFTFTAR